MSTMVAKLIVVLMADEVVVAQIEDNKLWRQLHELSEQRAGETPQFSAPAAVNDLSTGGDIPQEERLRTALTRMADQLGISAELLNDTCAPRLTPPYLHLDKECWSSMKSAVPVNGPWAFYKIAPAATLMSLWFTAAGLGNPTQAQAQGALDTIGEREVNRSRGIQHAAWLESLHRGQVAIKPSHMKRALILARAYCTQDWRPWLDYAL